MTCSLLRTWLGTSLLMGVLAAGCQSPRRSAAPAGPASPRLAAAPPMMPPTAYNTGAIGNPTVPLSAVPPSTPPISTAYAATTTTAPVPEATEEAAEEGAESEKTAAEETPAVQPPINVYKDGAVARRTFTDITAHPKFAHDPNYHWLVGKLDYSKIQQAWTLRFASVEEDDRYGGSVTLMEPGEMKEFRSGQLVRVEGRMENPDDFHARPPFRVQSIRAVEP